MTEEKKKRGRPKLADKKKPKNLKLSLVAHKQLDELSKSSGKSQAVIVEKLLDKAVKNKKLIE